MIRKKRVSKLEHSRLKSLILPSCLLESPFFSKRYDVGHVTFLCYASEVTEVNGVWTYMAFITMVQISLSCFFIFF